MALTEETLVDKIEIVENGTVQVARMLKSKRSVVLYTRRKL